MRHLKAILAVAVVVALLAISGNGKDGGTSGGDDSDARPAAGATIPGAGATTSDTGATISDIGAPSTPSPGGHWPTWPESASVKHQDCVELSCRVIVYSRPEAVWEVLTTVRSIFMWYPHWEREENMLRKLAAVGDTVAFHQSGDPVGRSVVTWLEPLDELRIVHELEDGRWFGSIMVSLDRTDRGVGLTYEELLPSSGLDIEDERRRVCKQTVLIKRLAEGE